MHFLVQLRRSDAMYSIQLARAKISHMEVDVLHMPPPPSFAAAAATAGKGRGRRRLLYCTN
jgi:hypothetical protein